MKEKRWGPWPWIKAGLALVVLAAVGWRFWRDLGKLDPDRPAPDLGWLAVAGALYLAGMGFSAAFWTRLLGRLGSTPGTLAAVRAYYVSQLGKYVPGKALALMLRVGLAGPPAATAALAAFYEVLATMASGSLVALAFAPSWQATGMALALLAATAGPILPPVFNLVSRRVVKPFTKEAPPRVPWSAFAEGLVLTAPCWLLFGLALACALRAVDAPVPSYPFLVAATALSYVAGFVVPISPGGLGVREYVLALLLVPPLDAGHVALAVLLLRLAWTLAEAVAAGILYWVPVPPVGIEVRCDLDCHSGLQRAREPAAAPCRDRGDGGAGPA